MPTIYKAYQASEAFQREGVKREAARLKAQFSAIPLHADRAQRWEGDQYWLDMAATYQRVKLMLVSQPNNRQGAEGNAGLPKEEPATEAAGGPLDAGRGAASVLLRDRWRGRGVGEHALDTAEAIQRENATTFVGQHIKTAHADSHLARTAVRSAAVSLVRYAAQIDIDHSLSKPE
jgi:GNAT superfamily N-acetyltransferase